MAPLTTAGPGAAVRPVPHPPAALQQLLAEECDEQTVRTLQPHLRSLVNYTEVALRTATGEQGLRELLRYITVLHRNVEQERVARSYAEHHCEALRRQLLAEREGRNSDGFRMALGAMGQSKALEAEREAALQARRSLESQVWSLGSRLKYVTEQMQQQAFELQGLRQYYAEAEVAIEERLRAEVQRQQDLLVAQHQQAQREALEHAQLQCERRVTEARRAEAAARAELEQERDAAAASRDEAARMEAAIGPWRTLKAARLPCVLELVRWLREDGKALAQVALPTKGRVPVLALEWPPHTALEASVCWSALDNAGFLGALARLCSGEAAPEDLELTVCCVEGRWLGALHGDEEAPRLAALLAYQALRLDAAVFASCRVVPMKRHLLPRGVLDLDPEHRNVPPVGAGRFRAPKPEGPVWQVGVHPRPPPPADRDEERLRAIVRGCPFERVYLAALSYVRAAHPDALARPPPPSSGFLPAGAATPA